jgi:predicted GIY-YIG superfamily endonuclease
MPESICAEADEIRRELSGKRQPKLVSRSVDEMVRDFLEKKPLFVLEKGLQCPPLASSVVYLLECPSGWYVGETDNLSQRFKTHFQSDKQPSRMLVWKVSNKSVARKVEATLGTYLQTQGVTLLSVNDNNHTHFGGH